MSSAGGVGARLRAARPTAPYARWRCRRAAMRYASAASEVGWDCGGACGGGSAGPAPAPWFPGGSNPAAPAVYAAWYRQASDGAGPGALAVAALMAAVGSSAGSKRLCPTQHTEERN